MQQDCAPAVFQKRTSVKRPKTSRGLTITRGMVGINRRYNYSLTRLGVNPGRRKRLCPVEFRVLTRFTPGYVGAILTLTRSVIVNRSRFQHWSCSANWMTLFRYRQAPSESQTL